MLPISRNLQVGRAGTSVNLTFQRGSERDESYGFYQVNLTRGHLNMKQPTSAVLSPSAGSRAFQSVQHGSSSGLQRSTQERVVHQPRSYEHRAMVSLDSAPPAGYAPLFDATGPSASSIPGAAQTMAAPSTTSAEAAALLSVLERVLHDSDIRSQQAGFATLLRDFDLCVIQRAAN
jgi:hypothetical protein